MKSDLSKSEREARTFKAAFGSEREAMERAEQELLAVEKEHLEEAEGFQVKCGLHGESEPPAEIDRLDKRAKDLKMRFSGLRKHVRRRCAEAEPLYEAIKESFNAGGDEAISLILERKQAATDALSTVIGECLGLEAVLGRRFLPLRDRILTDEEGNRIAGYHKAIPVTGPWKESLDLMLQLRRIVDYGKSMDQRDQEQKMGPISIVLNSETTKAAPRGSAFITRSTVHGDSPAVVGAAR